MRLWWEGVVVLSVGESVSGRVSGGVFVVGGRVLCGRCETRGGDGRAAA